MCLSRTHFSMASRSVVPEVPSTIRMEDWLRTFLFTSWARWSMRVTPMP